MRRPGPAALIVAGCLTLSSVAVSAPAPTNDKQITDTLLRAIGDHEAGRFREALAEVKAANEMMTSTRELAKAIHGMIVEYAISAKDYPSAISELKEMISTGEGGNPERQLLDQLQSGHYP